MKNLKLSLFLFVCFTLCYSINAQIEVSEILQESKIVQTESNKLYFVDFWATWCGPCVYSKKILTVLQQQYPRDFHAISISEENPELVERFIKKNPTLLTSVVDNDGATFKKFEVKALPQGILFNAKGEKLWEGHPSDLKSNLLNRFLKENSVRKPLKRFLKIVKSKAEITKDYLPKKDLEIKESNNCLSELEIMTLTTHIKLEGSLKQILGHLSKINEKQIQISDNLNKNYSIYIDRFLLKAENGIDYKILDKLGLSVNKSTIEADALILKIKNANFWDTNQIDWGDNDSNFLVSDTDISADNVSLKDLTYQISKVLNIPIIITGNNKQIYDLHDWQLHYKYFEFMENNLEEYGIKLKKENTEIPQYIITKKAP
ncbi:TlpA family protein disulfide reductase [Winogradskyella litorisediminis]|uniref:TlpA family protein disulfide reductase n=1 Tax=Winogradskyella litorisediminis TaxID=1156618 RepID=A0ABW3N9L3_9FLAO